MKLTFWSLLIPVLIFGLGVGAAFAAGIAFQQSRPPQAAAAAVQPSTASGSSGGAASAGSAQDRSAQAGTAGMMGRGTLSGTVEKVEGRTITLTTQQGSSQVVLQDGASIQRMQEASLEDLKQGARITVSGERKDDGSFAASSLQILTAAR